MKNSMKTPDQKKRSKQLGKEIRDNLERYEYLRAHGGSDPFWSDRIIFAERPIYDNICEEEVDKVSGWFYERYPDNATGAVPLTAHDIENLEMKVIGNVSDE